MQMKVDADRQSFKFCESADKVHDLIQIFYKKEFGSVEALANINAASQELNKMIVAIVKA